VAEYNETGCLGLETDSGLNQACLAECETENGCHSAVKVVSGLATICVQPRHCHLQLMIRATFQRLAGRSIPAWRRTIGYGMVLLCLGFPVLAAAEGGVPVKAAASISLAGLTQRYSGAPRPVEVTTNPGGLKVRVEYNGVETPPVLPGRYRIVASVDDAHFSGVATDVMTVGVTALVRHAIDNEGAIDGSVQVTSAENLLLDGRSSISGDLLLPGDPSLDVAGFPMIVGTVDANGIEKAPVYSVFLRDNAVIRYLVRHVDPLPIPTVAAAPSAGTRDISISDRSAAVVDWHDIRDIIALSDSRTVTIPPGSYGRLTVVGDAPVVLGDASGNSPAVYQFDEVTVRGGARLRVAGPVVLVVASGLDVDGEFGDAQHAHWITVATADRGLLLRPGAQFAGVVLAPKGQVTIGVGSRLNGQIVADRLVVDAGGVLADPAL